MNIAELIGELDSAVSEAREAGERVRKAIEGLKSIFGSLGVVGQSVTVVEPTFSLEEELEKCPYCEKRFPPWKRPHRDSPRYIHNFRIIRHIANQRMHGATDHGILKEPIPW